MADYIDKEKLIADIVDTGITDYKTLPFEVAALFIECVDRQNEIMAIIERQPAAEVKPVRHGHWIFKRQHHDADECNCSNRGQLMTTVYGVRMAYCPRCGFIMDGGAENGHS